MAYNNREWDRGKDHWNDDVSYNNGGKDTMHSREDEFYGDGKRRKINNGHAYEASYAYEEPAYNADPGQGRSHDYPQSHSNEDRSQRGFAKKRLAASEPSPHVIFLGLDPDFTEADLQAYLASNNCSIETVTIIRDRSTGVSKGFGFAQFTSTEHARAFVDPLFPFLQLPPPASHGASATATFYKALETGVPHNGRRVKIDYSQSASPHEKGRFGRQNMNDGTRDIGNAQAPVLLFRGLDALSGPQAIYQAMLNSSGPGYTGAKGMKRIILIKDKVTMASFGFAFVEFVDTKSASSVLAATMSPTIHPAGFRISDRPVAASFAHPYSFQPVDQMLRDEACLPSSPGLGGMEGSWVRYWDETSMIAMLEFEVEEPVEPVTAAKERKEKRKHKDSEASRPVFSVGPSKLPVSDKPVTLSFSKTKQSGNNSGLAPVKLISLGFSSTDDPSIPDSVSDSCDMGNTMNKVKSVTPLIASKKTVKNISKWNQVQEELTQSVGAAPSALASLSSANEVKAGPTQPESQLVTQAEAEFEFSDTSAKTCLLCARQFKSIEQLMRHSKESDLHKKNLKDSNLREVARRKAVAARETTDMKDVEQTPKYRDRASERRIMHNQPDHVPMVVEKDRQVKRRPVSTPPPPTPAPPLNPGQDDSNVGNKLLKMMGWKEGTGLGSSSEGRVDPIQTAIYAPGAGLGASKGKEIGKYSEGYSGYVHMAQDAARERYGN